jgi:hypothetical protein
MQADPAPIFFSVGQDTYRLRFPALLEGFDGALLEENPNGRFDSDRRDYFIRGYLKQLDARVSEIGSDLQPARIEATFTSGGKAAVIPPDVRDIMIRRNEEASKGRTLIYIDGKLAVE